MDNLAIYIHWPFCARICPYCDFNVYKNRGQNAALIKAICVDLTGWRKETGARNVTSLHFGGGTPSLLSGGELAEFITLIRQLWTLDPACEIAIEANPADADKPKWEAYRSAGITRLSLGVQSFHDDALKLLGRDHDGVTANDALRLATEIFPSVSMDLIFGWQGQTEDLLRADLDAAIALQPGHISAYQLTIEPGTAFDRAEIRGERKAVGEDASTDFYGLIENRLTEAGYGHYEVSNYAKPNHHSRHNMSYWKGEDYIGVGPGAHGRITVDNDRYATVASLQPAAYIKRVNETGIGADKDPLSQENWGDEYIIMGLRIEDGISLSRYESITGAALNSGDITALKNSGHLLINGDSLKATAKGRLVLNTVTEKLLT